jgi:glycosyltransferase involved in cell wall biosynthesis
LVRAFLEIVREQAFREWRLVIAGDGEGRYVRTLKESVAREDPQGRVSFAGWVEGEDKDALLAGSDLFALISQHENFGISVAEAMRAGRAVVVSDQVQIHDDISAREAGWVTASRLEDVTAALRSAMADAGERKRRGRNGIDLVNDRYAWPVVAESLERLYREVIANARRA